MINSIPSSHANTVVPYVPLGRQPVGQESIDLKNSSFKPLEQVADSARNENRRTPYDNQVKGQTVRDLATTDGAEHDSRSVQERNQSSDSNKESAKKERQVKGQQQVAELSAVDAEVRAHEHAHAAAGGDIAGAPTYEFVKGPDGNSYAVGGEVSISTSSIPGDPEATIRKAQRIRAAANAPVDPSPQDRRVASQASVMEAQARAQLQVQFAQITRDTQAQAEAKAQSAKSAGEKRAETSDEAKKESLIAAQKQAEDNQKRQAERIDILTSANKKAIDITRHLVAIGAVKSMPSVGSFLNQKA